MTAVGATVCFFQNAVEDRVDKGRVVIVVLYFEGVMVHFSTTDATD